MMSVRNIFIFCESVYSDSHLSTVLPLVGWYEVRFECVNRAGYNLGSKNASDIVLGYNFVKEYGTLCYSQTQCLMLLGSNNWHLM
jgi:hypothetical protein